MSTKSKVKIRPRAKQVLLEPVPEEARVTDSGLLTPDNVEQERKAVGTVLAVGDKVEDIQVGDKVIYGAFAGESIKMRASGKDVDYKLLFDEDILAFIDDA